MERAIKLKRIFGIVLAATLLIGFLGGCVRYKDGKPVEETTNEVQKEEKPKEEIKQEEKQPEVDQQATSDLKSYINENFSETSWYGFIEGIEVIGNQVNIYTNVMKYENGKEQTENIDNAVWGYTNTNDSKYHFKEVNIFDKDNKVILSEDNPLN